MAYQSRAISEQPPRMPLSIEFHYEVDERGENYRVWEEQLSEPIGLDGDPEGGERCAVEQHP